MFFLYPQSPVELSDRSQPQPDLVLLRRRDDFYKRSLPLPSDILLVIEVSDLEVVAHERSDLRLVLDDDDAGVVDGEPLPRVARSWIISRRARPES